MLSDFGIHWFDAACSFFPLGSAQSVFATTKSAPGQPIKPPLVASSVVTYAQGIATLSFNGCSRHGAQESCSIVGSTGTLRAVGDLCGITAVDIVTAAGSARAELAGAWFPDGFRGAMGELLCAIEENREPENSASNNLLSLRVALAAVQSADQSQTVNL